MRRIAWIVLWYCSLARPNFVSAKSSINPVYTWAMDFTMANQIVLSGMYFSLGSTIRESPYSVSAVVRWNMSYTHDRFGLTIGKPLLLDKILGIQVGRQLFFRSESNDYSLSFFTDICYQHLQVEDEHIVSGYHFTKYGKSNDYKIISINRNLMLEPKLSFCKNGFKFTFGYHFVTGKLNYGRRQDFQGPSFTIGAGVDALSSL